tara:strand:+ start:2117 stop:2533 length:417 start_codon:yes stop_codon:yes gene_type:complete
MNQVITPDIWGPHGWKFLHYISFGYPENPTINIKNQYKNFFLSLEHVLPCVRCSNHYRENLSKYSLDEALTNRDSLIRWVIDIHNDVNRDNNKKVYDYDEAIQLYTQTQTPEYLDYCFRILVLFVVIYFAYKLLKNKI